MDPSQQPDHQEVLDITSARLRRMRYFRKQYDQKRALFYRQYIGQRDAMKYPDNLTPRANTFVPYPLSNVETIVSRVLDAFFSFDPWFECSGWAEADDVAATKMELLLHHKLRQAKLVPAMETLIRNIGIYGHAAIKVDWDFDFDTLTKPSPVFAQDENGQPVINPQTGQPVVLGFQPQTFQVPRCRPKLVPIDVYDFMVDPDGGIAAHLCEKTLGQMKREAASYKQATGNDLYIPDQMALLAKRVSERIKDGEQFSPDDVVIRLAEVWDESAGTVVLQTMGDDWEAVSWKDLRASYRAASYSTYKRKAYAGENILLYYGPNPFAHKRIPILHTSYIKLPNEIYGLGAIEIVSDLTEGLNKMVNMVTDNWNLGINRRFAYDVNADIDHEALNSYNVPGGKVGVNGKPTDVLEPLPLFTPAAGDYQILELYKGMIEMTSGVSDFYQKGMGSPTGNGTATGVTNIINESNFRFKMFIRNLEIDVLQPLLEMCASMVQQFMTDQQEIQITKDVPGIPKWQSIMPEEVIGSMTFSLVAANYATNKVLRQRNLMAFLNILMSSAPAYINPGAAIHEVGKVLEIRNLGQIIKPDQQVQMEQAASQQQQVQMMVLESMLNTESKARLQQSKPQPVGQGKGGGRPAKMQFEGQIPGAGLSGHIRDLAQSLGANGMGLGGMHEGA